MPIYEKIGAVILAAGESKRMGFPKQLIEICGEKIIRIVVMKVLNVGFGDIVVVLGHMAGDIARYIDDMIGIKIIVNPRYREGMSTSLIEGIKNLRQDIEAFMVILGDQPFVSKETMEKIIETYYGMERKPLMVVPTYRGLRGNPVLISSRIAKEIMSLRGDIGARALMERYKAYISYIETQDPGVVLDIDTKEDLEKALKTFKERCVDLRTG
ncbi:MAG: nucleotidyltransferase family protein [Desulfurococcales archaeon]|jgi:molybdenum cofactor cytidylyltransferase